MIDPAGGGGLWVKLDGVAPAPLLRMRRDRILQSGDGAEVGRRHWLPLYLLTNLKAGVGADEWDGAAIKQHTSG
jgi:hypothetical protein